MARVRFILWLLAVLWRLQYNVFHLHLKWQLICADCNEKRTFMSSKYEDYFLKWSKSIKKLKKYQELCILPLFSWFWRQKCFNFAKSGSENVFYGTEQWENIIVRWASNIFWIMCMNWHDSTYSLFFCSRRPLFHHNPFFRKSFLNLFFVRAL